MTIWEFNEEPSKTMTAIGEDCRFDAVSVIRVYKTETGLL